MLPKPTSNYQIISRDEREYLLELAAPMSAAVRGLLETSPMLTATEQTSQIIKLDINSNYIVDDVIEWLKRELNALFSQGNE